MTVVPMSRQPQRASSQWPQHSPSSEDSGRLSPTAEHSQTTDYFTTKPLYAGRLPQDSACYLSPFVTTPTPLPSAPPHPIPNSKGSPVSSPTATSQSHSQHSSHSRSSSETALANHTLDARFLSLYELTGNELGAGGTGFVLSAVMKNTEVETEVAVKFMYRDRIPVTSWFRDRKLGGIVPIEVSILRRLDHENVIRYLDYFEDEKFCYFVMESHGTPWNTSDAIPHSTPPTPSPPLPFPSPPISYPISNISPIPISIPMPRRLTFSHAASSAPPLVSSPRSFGSSFNSPPLATRSLPRSGRNYKHGRRISQDLFECIEVNPYMEEDTVRFIFKQVAEAVAYLHRNNVIHRDIKDENVVIDSALHAKLIDFGSASFIPLPTNPFRTFIGSPRFAAPELLSHPIQPYTGPPQDIWALGVLLYTIAYSSPPFTSVQRAMEGKIEHGRWRRSEGLRRLVERMLVVDVAGRVDAEGVLSDEWLKGVEKVV